MPDAHVDRRHLGAGDASERVDRRAPLAVGGEHRLGHTRRIGAHLGRRGDAVIGGEDQPRRSPDGRPVGSLPPGHPGGDLVEPGQGTARSQDVGGAVVHGGAGGLVGQRQMGELVVEQGHRGVVPVSSRTIEGASRRSARPATRRKERSARAAQRWFTEPRTSRYRRPRAVSGCTPRPTSFVTTTTGSARRRAALRGRVRALDDLVVGAVVPHQVRHPQRETVDDRERAGRRVDRTVEIDRLLDRRPAVGTLRLGVARCARPCRRRDQANRAVGAAQSR